jgi:hypothetical protein
MPQACARFGTNPLDSDGAARKAWQGKPTERSTPMTITQSDRSTGDTLGFVVSGDVTKADYDVHRSPVCASPSTVGAFGSARRRVPNSAHASTAAATISIPTVASSPTPAAPVITEYTP